jgi:membrane-bound acyltransferase YfiQ involved in biofilm formation
METYSWAAVIVAVSAQWVVVALAYVNSRRIPAVAAAAAVAAVNESA